MQIFESANKGKLTTIQFLLTPSNSLGGLTGSYGYPSWSFNVGLAGTFDMTINSVEFCSSSPTGTVMSLACAQVNSQYSGQNPSYLFSVYDPQIAWTKREWFQPDQLINGQLNFNLSDKINGAVSSQLQAMQYCLVTMNFYGPKN